VTHDTVKLWEFPSDATPDGMAAFAAERPDAPDAAAVVVSVRGDVLTVQLASGALSGDPASRFLVERHGTYALHRREDWPPLRQGGPARIVLALRAWPGRAPIPR
jgi:hypothetical protein